MYRIYIIFKVIFYIMLINKKLKYTVLEEISQPDSDNFFIIRISDIRRYRKIKNKIKVMTRTVEIVPNTEILLIVLVHSFMEDLLV